MLSPSGWPVSLITLFVSLAGNWKSEARQVTPVFKRDDCKAK